MSTYKILVPKPAAKDESGATTGLYAADEIVTPSEEWQQKIMDTFVENGWAIEVKTVEPEVNITVEAEIVAEETVTLTVDEATVEVEPPKKKRGRPKKNPEPEEG